MADEIPSEIECFYKTMTRREPHKRQVKLVKPHLLQLDFAALGESSDDSDFKLGSADDSEEGGKAVGSSSSTTSQNSNSEAKSSSSDDNEDGDDEEKKSNNKNENSDDTNNNLPNHLSNFNNHNNIDISKSNDMKIPTDNQTRHLSKQSGQTTATKTHICSVCLEDFSSSSNEMFECDGCFITVHEGCLGVSESQSVSSSDSSSTMEPWFCDPCKAGVKPHCELCPNLGGLLKETDTGKWVHLICALYTSGVAFGDVDKLTNVTLFEMAYTKWGSKECGLCEDRRFSRVGVCISCDAGMCRNHFHVTCGQREGLLTEAASDEEIADPFFAYCRQHMQRGAQKKKKKHWILLNKQLQQAALTQKRQSSSKHARRIERKLHKQQLKHDKLTRKQCWVPEEKLPRLMLSCPQVLKQLFRKAQLLGIVESGRERVKKGSINAGFNAHFINYYNERNASVEELKKGLVEMKATTTSLQQQQLFLNNNINTLRREKEGMDGRMDECGREWIALVGLMESLCGKKLMLSGSIEGMQLLIQKRNKKNQNTTNYSQHHYTTISASTRKRSSEDDEERDDGSKGMKLRGKHLLKETSKFAHHQQERMRERSRGRNDNKRLKLDDEDDDDGDDGCIDDDSSFIISSEDSNNSNDNIGNNNINNNNRNISNNNGDISNKPHNDHKNNNVIPFTHENKVESIEKNQVTHSKPTDNNTKNNITTTANTTTDNIKKDTSNTTNSELIEKKEIKFDREVKEDKVMMQTLVCGEKDGKAFDAHDLIEISDGDD